jgi:hypothetical protein
MEEDRSAGDRELDETLEETFPASDAPGNTVETGIRVGNHSAVCGEASLGTRR